MSQMNDNKEGFSYSYSAKEQEEIKKIRDKYTKNEPEREENKIERLRRLDASVTKKGTVVSLIIGIAGTLILGTGMSLAMTSFGEILGAYSEFSMLIGILVGLFGILGVAIAYPIYNLINKRERERIAPEIIRLSDELMR